MSLDHKLLSVSAERSTARKGFRACGGAWLAGAEGEEGLLEAARKEEARMLLYGARAGRDGGADEVEEGGLEALRGESASAMYWRRKG